MSTEVKDIAKKLQPLIGFIKNYIKFIFLIFMLMIFTFLVFRINQFNSRVPTEEALEEKLQNIQKPVLDDSVITKIQQLEDQNIEVKSLFEKARQNPFDE